ncbi:MAG: hypothetical protein Q8M31_08835 [Beijerinckiaceae bacterium]|nr:hypothetical protein [Beijerinckiaceae bacterium]
MRLWKVCNWHYEHNAPGLVGDLEHPTQRQVKSASVQGVAYGRFDAADVGKLNPDIVKRNLIP